jgi:hypothetical protein
MGSLGMKASLMSYYRYKRGYICVDECRCMYSQISDVLVDTGKEIIDVEIKVTKSDLIRGEAKKDKHRAYKVAEGKKCHPNKFILCVPEKLKDVAIEWVKETNNNYGIVIYTPPTNGFRYKRADFEHNLHFIKNAKSFNSLYNKEYFQERIAKRLSSALTNKYQETLIKHAFEQKLRKE